MKNLLYILLLSLFFISSCQETASLGCTEITAVNYSPLVDVDDGSCQYLEVGDYYQGGIIFYIDETGLSGFIASCNDLSDFQPWGCVVEPRPTNAAMLPVGAAFEVVGVPALPPPHQALHLCCPSFPFRPPPLLLERP